MSGTFYLIGRDEIINRDHIIGVKFFKGGWDCDEGKEQPHVLHITTTELVMSDRKFLADPMCSVSKVIVIHGDEALDVWNQFFDMRVKS